ncbi:MAG: sensor histidine kinase, partial [Actinomycetia bacterium]|nr:sensor histidine kinase [Actinomycetes bacterium]
GVSLCIEDDGPGLPAGAEEIVFDRFMRLDDRLSRVTGGVGLGLTISRGIVQAHGGSITARRLVQGVAFDVRLPASDHGALARVLHESTP